MLLLLLLLLLLILLLLLFRKIKIIQKKIREHLQSNKSRIYLLDRLIDNISPLLHTYINIIIMDRGNDLKNMTSSDYKKITNSTNKKKSFSVLSRFDKSDFHAFLRENSNKLVLLQKLYSIPHGKYMLDMKSKRNYLLLLVFHKRKEHLNKFSLRQKFIFKSMKFSANEAKTFVISEDYNDNPLSTHLNGILNLLLKS